MLIFSAPGEKILWIYFVQCQTKLEIFSQTATRLNCNDCHGGKIKCKTKVLSRSCPQRRQEFPTSTGEHFAVAAVAAAVDIT